jgi:hypothetical protein
MPTTQTGTAESAIFARLFEGPNGKLSPSVARKFLKLSFSDTDQERMEDLAQRDQQGRLTAQERDELLTTPR